MVLSYFNFPEKKLTSRSDPVKLNFNATYSSFSLCYCVVTSSHLVRKKTNVSTSFLFVSTRFDFTLIYFDCTSLQISNSLLCVAKIN